MASTSSNGTGAYAPANYIGLNASVATPLAADTALASAGGAEIYNAGGGLNRAQATYAHTAGTSSYTLTKAFTANSSDGASNTPGKIGVFNAPTTGTFPVGTMVFETLITSPPTLLSGDSLTITETVNI